MSKTYRRNDDDFEPRNRPGRRSARFQPPPTGAQVDLMLAEPHVRDVLESVLYGQGLALAPEIARRVRMNAEIVRPDQLRDQVLIVLADYRNHAWVSNTFRSEGERLHLATRILDCFK